MTRGLLWLGVAALAGCQTTAAPETIGPRSAQAKKNFVVLDAQAPACSVGQDCAVTFAVVATGDTHVNKEYPHRFTPAKHPAVTFQDPAPVTHTDEQHASWTVPYRAKSAAPLTGEVAVSVCNESSCFIEKLPVALADKTAPSEPRPEDSAPQ